MHSLDPGDKGEKIDDLLAQLQWPATLGFAEAHGRVPRVWETERLALIGREIVPAAAGFDHKPALVSAVWRSMYG